MVKKYYQAISPDISKLFSYESPDVRGMGGAVFMQIGEKVPIRIIDHPRITSSSNNSSASSSRRRLTLMKGETVDQIEVVYHDSSYNEFYFYR